MLKDVTQKDGFFYAINDDAQNVVIEQSISFLFLKTVDRPQSVSYMAITYRHHNEVLEQIQDYLTGATHETGLLDRVVLRHGWMDRHLNSLRFTSALDLFRSFRNNTISKRDRLKLMQICKQLSISMRGLFTYPASTPELNITELL